MIDHRTLTRAQNEEVTINTLAEDHQKLVRELFDLRAKLIEQKIVPGDDDEFIELTDLVNCFYIVYSFYCDQK